MRVLRARGWQLGTKRFAAVGARSASLATAIAALAAFGAAQQPTFRTEANYVRVDVFPTRDGAPVDDLTAADFDVLENGIPQRIEQFEHIVVRGNVAQELRAEPNTVAQSRAMAADPRARVFVVFLDTGHVDVAGSHNIRRPLVDALNGLIGPDDLVAVMTPDMSPSDLTFARRTTTIEGFLSRHWPWGDNDKLNPVDPAEERYQECYGPQSPIALEMIARRRENMTLDSLENLVVSLRGLRDERKAIIAITDGWVIFGPDPALAPGTAPAPPTIGIDPRNGRLTASNGDVDVPAFRAACERDRFALAQIDDRDGFRQLPDVANRANVSFYPVDPRGLPAFDSSIANPLPLAVDAGFLRARLASLRTLAESTDGIAVVNSNDLGRGFRRIVDDLSSYYLLGYYSTGKLDGKFHAISVRVKRQGVQVRARRGYLAASASEVTAAGAARNNATKEAPTAGAAAALAEAHAVEGAIASLAGYARDVPLRLQIAAGWKPGDQTSAAMWVVGEIATAALAGESWIDGFEATATLATANDQSMASGRVAVPRGARTFHMALTPSAPLLPGEYVLRVGARAGGGAIPIRESARLTIPPAPIATGALFLRRGPATANRETPTADLRFRRNEQLRVEVPGDAAGGITARLLDRTGRPLAVPVAAAVRNADDGSRWHTAELALAPLAAGDYVIEIASGDRRSLAAFRLVP